MREPGSARAVGRQLFPCWPLPASQCGAPTARSGSLGGDVGDESAAILDAGRKPAKMYAHEETIKQFDYRQYLFARKATVSCGPCSLRPLTLPLALLLPSCKHSFQRLAVGGTW